MTIGSELAVVVENGVLRPEQKLNFPEHTRLLIRIQRVEATAEGAAEAKRLFAEIRAAGQVRLGGWHPTREEMHERR